jgi:hypothetical protein
MMKRVCAAVPRHVRAALLALVSSAASDAMAFQVLPKVSDVDRKLSAAGSNSVLNRSGQWVVDKTMPYMKSPVHESITLAAIGCGEKRGAEARCVTVRAVGENRILLYGVRWPDDPPFTLNADKPPRSQKCDVNVTMRSTAQPACWLTLFNDAGAGAKKVKGKPAYGPGDYLLYRSHYGDLQFMHAMGAFDGERARDTVARMRMWAEFLWGVAINDIPVGKFLREVGIPDLGTYFPGDITATNLFATGIIEVRKDLDQVAIGALLHMVQDSFSRAHAQRAVETGATCQDTRFDKPGQILKFYSYAEQVGASHDEEDTVDALKRHTLQISPSAVDVSRAFLTLWRERKNWAQASGLFDCVFDIQDPDAPAQAGRFGRPPVPVSTDDPSRQ